MVDNVKDKRSEPSERWVQKWRPQADWLRGIHATCLRFARADSRAKLPILDSSILLRSTSYIYVVVQMILCRTLGFE